MEHHRQGNIRPNGVSSGIAPVNHLSTHTMRFSIRQFIHGTVRITLLMATIGLIIQRDLQAQEESIRPPTHTFEDDAALPVVKRFTDYINVLKAFNTTVKVHIEDPQSGLKRDLEAQLQVKGNAYRFKCSDLIIYCDGITRWDYLPAPNEVTITKADDENVSPSALSPSMFLRDLPSRFKIRYRGQRAVQGAVVHDISLYPKKVADSPYTQIHLTYSDKRLTPQIATYHSRDGMSLRIEFTEFITSGYQAESCSFDSKKHPKATVIDLR